MTGLCDVCWPFQLAWYSNCRVSIITNVMQLLFHNIRSVIPDWGLPQLFPIGKQMR
jgi:hypothetical protein